MLIDKFAKAKHSHKIAEIEGLEDKLNESLKPLPDIETSEEVIAQVNALTSLVNKLIPQVGEIYITMSNENPSVRFGGTWEQIKDTFLLAAGDTYAINQTGGEATHTLTVEEIPSHAHEFNRHQLWRNEEVPVSGLSDGYGASNKTLEVYRDTTTSIGGTQPHNNMPPYLTVYVWRRIE